MSCEDIPSLLDLQKVKKHAEDFGRLMGTGTGTSTNGVTGQVRPTYNKVIEDLGFKPGSGDFTTGFTVMPGERDIAWYDLVSLNWYSYLGVIPTGGYDVAPGTNPVGDADWKPVTDQLLREELAEPDGVDLIGGAAHQDDLDALSVQFETLSPVVSKSVNISSLGLSDTDAIFNATQLNAKLIELQSQGINTIYVDRSYAIDTGYNYSTGMYTRRVSRIPEFNWIDAGGVVTGLYGFQLQTLHEPAYSANNGSDFKVKGQHADSTLVVVMMGDSISAEWADSLANGINQWEVIKSEISRQNPGKTISFFNLAIGGQTWAQANTKPTFFPSWYTDTGLDWVYYVVLHKPDIVIFGFGMNDSTGFNMGTMVSTTNKVKGALPNVHMCMIPCMVPSRSSDYSSGHGFDGLIHQEGRNFAAGAERTYAEFYGLSVLDLNRAEVAWRDGKDLVACEMTEVPATPVSGAYRADPCVDFSFECKISGWDRTTPIHVNCGGDEEDLIYIGADTGNFVVTGRTEYINTYYSSGRTAVVIPTVDFYLTVSVMNNQASVYLSNGPAPINDIGNILVASFRVIRHGGIVRPAIGSGGLVTGNVAALRVMLGQPKQVRKELTDTDIWGLGDASPSRKSPYGGNGINHPSGQGLAQLIKPVMEAQDFRIKLQDFTLTGVYASGATDWQSGYPPKITYMAQDNIIIFSGGLKRSGSVPAVVFTIPDYARLAAPIDKIFQAYGIGGGAVWGSQMFRLDPAGNVWHEVGDITYGCTLEGATVKVK